MYEIIVKRPSKAKFGKVKVLILFCGFEQMRNIY